MADENSDQLFIGQPWQSRHLIYEAMDRTSSCSRRRRCLLARSQRLREVVQVIALPSELVYDNRAIRSPCPTATRLRHAQSRSQTPASKRAFLQSSNRQRQDELLRRRPSEPTRCYVNVPRQCSRSRGGFGSRPGAIVSLLRIRPSRPLTINSPPPCLWSVCLAASIASLCVL
ncbi:MAG: hypothetical protein V7609_1604 [Verrucomicrobiota bacterium]